MIYQSYLDGFGSTEIDSITKTVAHHTEQVLKVFHHEVTIEENKPEPYFKLFYHQKYIARVIEGCNGISVIILFISFVVAFSGKLKPTLLFIFGGSLIIYILNVLRIVILCILMYRFPQQEHLLHGVVFPLIIYGTVFILWVIWVNKFSKYASKTAK